MDNSEFVRQATALRERIQKYGVDREREAPTAPGAKAQVVEFLRLYVGPRSSFTLAAGEVQGYNSYQVGRLTAIIDSLIEYANAGLSVGISPIQQAQSDVVADFLTQASRLLQNSECHPAAAAVLAGASLEEFLRNWLEAAELLIDGAKPGIDAYASALRAEELITKQDAKDIVSWAGIRNHAAHGEWDSVSDRTRIQLMLDGISLFMRRHART